MLPCKRNKEKMMNLRKGILKAPKKEIFCKKAFG